MYLKRIEKEYPVKRNLINKAFFSNGNFLFFLPNSLQYLNIFDLINEKNWLISILFLVCCLTSRSRIFGLYLDIAITSEGIQYSTYARQLRFLSIMWSFCATPAVTSRPRGDPLVLLFNSIISLFKPQRRCNE